MRVNTVVKAMLAVCIISGLMVPIWINIVAPELEKISDDYTDTVMYLGEVQWRGGPGEEFESFIQVETHTEQVVDMNDSVVTLQLESIVENPLTDEIFWQVKSNITIDRYTKKYVGDAAYYSFPPNVEKQNYYNMRHYSYLPRTTFRYGGEENIKGLPVYAFSYNVTGIDSSENFPAWVAEGKHPVMDDWGYFWVEPASGHIVNAEDYWKTYFTDPSTGEVVYIDNGKIWYTEDTITKEILVAEELKQTYFLQGILIPSVLALISVGMAAGVAIYQRKVNRIRSEEEAAKLREKQLEEFSVRLKAEVEKRTRELKESEEKYSKLVENTRIGIALVQDGKFVFVNSTGQQLIGISSKDLIGKPYSCILSERGKRIAKERYKSRMRGEEVPSTYEMELQHREGYTIPVEISTKIISCEGRPTDLVMAYDLTERKQLEAQLLEAERLATIGKVTRMMGHDLRNPLQAIITIVYLVREAYWTAAESLSAPDRKTVEKLEVPKLLETIERQVWYMDKIVSDLQDYASPIEPKLTETNMHGLITDVISTIRVPENVKIVVKAEEGFPKLMVDSTLMKRTFTNLITNALQSMPEGGRLTIRLSRKGEAASISIQDTGVGIAKENLDKIFQPNFTTKAKGQGLGLSVCKRLVEAHGGSITVESKVGKGSTFTVKIPLRTEKGE